MAVCVDHGGILETRPDRNLIMAKKPKPSAKPKPAPRPVLKPTIAGGGY